MRWCVASTPTSPVSSASSSASSAWSSSLRRTNTPVSALDSLARDTPSPALRRSVHERFSAGGSGVADAGLSTAGASASGSGPASGLRLKKSNNVDSAGGPPRR